jgi:hypothetical protein
MSFGRMIVQTQVAPSPDEVPWINPRVCHHIRLLHTQVTMIEQTYEGRRHLSGGRGREHV